MAVYNINGLGINTAYDVDGSALDYVYDISQHQILPDGPSPTRQRLKVMSFNVGDFSGIDSQSTMLQQIVSANTPDIIGFQEFARTNAIPSLAQTMLTDYSTIVMSYHNNFNAIASKYGLTDITIADFETQDAFDIEQYNETRAYIKGYFTFNEKNICLINTHLTVLNNASMFAQFQELFDMAEEEEYVIITADFNTQFYNFQKISSYQNTYKMFVDAGYNLMTNSPVTGIQNTGTSSTTATQLSDLTVNNDSIIVSGNIEMESRVYDTTKFSYRNGSPIDHIPIMATLLI